MLSVIKLNVVNVSAIMPNAVMVSVIMLNVVMVSVMLNIFMVSVVAPIFQLKVSLHILSCRSRFSPVRQRLSQDQICEFGIFTGKTSWRLTVLTSFL
jgi:hypothetical protein